MTPQIKQRIEQIRRGEIPEGYKKTKIGIVPEEWEEKTVGKCIIEYDEKTTIENQYPVLTSARLGLMLQSEYYSNNQVTTSDNVGYNVLPRGYITYRSRSDDGKFKFNENTIIDKGIISYFYPVFSFNSNVSHAFMLSLLNHSIYRQSYSFVEGTAQQVLSLKKLQSLRYCVPSLAEQEKIAAILQTQDKVIELQQKKIEELKRLKKGYLSKMFPKKGCNVPEIRFPGFTAPWEQRKLGDMMNVTSVKRIHQSDWTDSGVRFLRARDIVAAAKNEEPDDYLYISKEKYEEYSALSGKVGVSDLLVTGVGTIGVPYLVRNLEPLYFKDGNIIWFQNSDKIDGKFLFYSFSAEQIQGFINESAGIGTVGTYTIESGKKTPISIPNQIEQAKVGEFFQQLDNLITLHQRKCDEEKQKKKALMQLLLTGIVRT